VNNSSQEQIFTITLDNDCTSTTSDTLTITNWDNVSFPSTYTDTITLTGSGGTTYSPYTVGTIETVDLSGIESFSTFTNWFKDEFEGRFPDHDRVMEMCKEYPGLEIAYRKFKEVYQMVKEDFDGKERERRNNR